MISIILPAFNEENTIIELLEKVRNVEIEGFEKEIIVIDDYSNDDTLILLNRNKNLYTKLIKLKVNGGKGAAVKKGLLEKNGNPSKKPLKRKSFQYAVNEDKVGLL